MLLGLVFTLVSWTRIRCSRHDGSLSQTGTGATDHQSFVEALQRAKAVIDQATRIGHHMQYLDIGGGFQDSNFESMAPTIREAVELHIPSDIQVIAEPGRYYARTAYTRASRFISSILRSKRLRTSRV